MTVEYVILSEYVAIAVEVTGHDVDTLMQVAKLDLTDSALHASAAGFGETEFYTDFIDRAAVLVVRLAKNHPLPDGNKQAAWISPRIHRLNGWAWDPYPGVDDAG